MANLNIQVKSRFKPFSYSELVQPLLMATQAHQQLEEAYSALGDKTASWERRINKEEDSELYDQYKSFSDDLASAVDELSKNGLTPLSRQGMLGLKSRYSQDIVPIEEAFTRRRQLSEDMRKARLQDPSLMYNDGDPASKNLKFYMDNPEWSPTVISGQQLEAQTAQVAKMYATEYLDKQMKLDPLGIPYQYRAMLKKGYSADEVAKAMLKDPSASQQLMGIVNSVLDANGVSDAIRDQAWYHAARGLSNAVGGSEFKFFTDNYGMQSKLAEDAFERKKQEEDEKRKKGISSTGVSYLVSNGDAYRYSKAINSMKDGQNGLKASIFGKKGDVNPIAVYETLQSRVREINSKYAAKRPLGMSTEDYAVVARGADLNPNRPKEIEEAKKQVMKDYGVSEVITLDQYQALKASGYEGGQPVEYSDLSEGLNNLVEQRTYYSTNMSEYSVADNNIRAQLSNWESLGQFSGKVYKLNADGTKGSAVKYKDLGLKSDDKTNGKEITGIYYSAFTPDKVIVQVGQSGERYLMDPNILGTAVARLLSVAQEGLNKGMDKTEASLLTTQALARILNEYNPTLSKTSSKV